MKKILAEATTEIYDRHGIYGEPDMLRQGALRVTSDGCRGSGNYTTESILPDHRVLVEYEGADMGEAFEVFRMIARSRVPDFDA